MEFWESIIFLMISLISFTTCIEVRLGYTSGADEPYTGAALSIALSDWLEHHETNHTFSISYRIPTCDRKKSVSAALELIQDERVDVIFGQVCSDACITAGYTYSYYNIPWFPTGCAAPELADTITFPNLIRLLPSYIRVGHAYGKLFDMYGWRKGVMITQNTGDCQLGAEAIQAEFELKGIEVSYWVALKNQVTENELEDGLLRLRDRGRIIIVCHTWEVSRRLMLAADRLNMVSAEYIYLYYHLIPDDHNGHPWIDQGDTTSYTQEEIEQLRKPFYSLKQVSLAKISYEHGLRFDKMAREVLQELPWNMTYESKNTSELFAHTMFLTDAVTVYLEVISKILEEGGDHTNGTLVFERAKEIDLFGYTGHVEVDEHGDRKPDMWIWDCKPDIEYCSPYATLEIQDDNSYYVEMLHLPYWTTADGTPPLDTPICGFMHENCQKKSNPYKTMGIIIGVIIVAVLALTVWFVVRQKNQERKLLEMAWKVKYNDIDFPIRREEDSSGNLRSLSKSTATSISNISSHFAPVYNGMQTAIISVNKKQLYLTRDLLWELKTMKDLTHDNINPFIGACIDPPNICILMAHCSRGSLYDMLQNDDIKLNWMFKGSFLHDITNGMTYLHSSLLHSHGKLSSMNCMVNSRWSVRISGYGLTRFTEGEIKDEDESETYDHLLWTAPEILRLHNSQKPLYGTPKGDVYSFGIILQEVVFRIAPFFGEMYARDVVNRVRCVEKIPFRPLIDRQCPEDVRHEVLDLMKRCWQEDPTDRPDFKGLKHIFKKMNEARHSSIMDKLVSMLEKYAHNLEGLLAQKSNELDEEKNRTDLLLHRMLPVDVATRLKKGELVPPQKYDKVTVFFAEIVGLSDLSLELEPAHLVEVLNSLYSTIDSVLDKHDIYKTDTVGETLMVVSGLPNRNGNRCVREIADVSLNLLKEIQSFRVRYHREKTVRLRAGAHIGPCMAAVVGNTVPRYCVFGDTVNTACKLAVTSDDNKIQVTGLMKSSLAPFSEYACLHSGKSKNSNEDETFWLHTRVLAPRLGVFGNKSPEQNH